MHSIGKVAVDGKVGTVISVVEAAIGPPTVTLAAVAGEEVGINA